MPFLALRALKPGHEHNTSLSRLCSQRSPRESYFGRKMDSLFAIPGPSGTGNVLHGGKQGSKGLHQLFVLSTHNLQQNQGPTSNQSTRAPHLLPGKLREMGEQGSLATGISKGQARRSKPCYKEQEEKGKTGFKAK